MTALYPYQIVDNLLTLPLFNSYRDYDKLVTRIAASYGAVAAGANVVVVGIVPPGINPIPIGSPNSTAAPIGSFSLIFAFGSIAIGSTDLVNPILVRQGYKLVLGVDPPPDVNAQFQIGTEFKYINESGVPPNTLYQGR